MEMKKKLENVKNTATSRKLEEEKKTKISEFEAIGTNMSNSWLGKGSNNKCN